MDPPRLTAGTVAAWTTPLAWVAGGVFLVACAAAMLALAQAHVDPHDGACIAVLARNLAATGRYGYAKYGVFELWPVEATTGPTLVVPIAAAFWLAGEGPFVANVACALFVLVLLAVVWWQMARHLTSLAGIASALLALAMIVGVTIEPSVALVVPRGEVVAGLLLILATLVAFGRDGVPSRGRAFASGVLLGLGASSKVLLLLPGAALFLGIVALGVGAPGWRRAVGIAIAWLAGAIAILAAVEVWKLASFGAWQPYADRWAEFVAFFQVAGSGLREGATALAERRTIAYRLGVLDENLGRVPIAFAIAFVVAPLALLGRARRAGGLGVAGRIALVLGAETLILTIWWLYRADIPWLRYLFFACMTAPLAVHFALLELGRRSPRGTSIALAAWGIVLGVALAASPAGTFAWPAPSAKQTARAAAVLDAARVVREIAAADPQARVWSAGWWQHWDVQSVAPLRLSDVLDPPSLALMSEGHDYLLTSDYFNWEQDARLLTLLDVHERRVAYRNAYFTLYRLHPGLARRTLRDRGPAGTAAPWRPSAGASD